jgi:hypothetical protein
LLTQPPLPPSAPDQSSRPCSAHYHVPLLASLRPCLIAASRDSGAHLGRQTRGISSASILQVTCSSIWGVVFMESAIRAIMTYLLSSSKLVGDASLVLGVVQDV